MRFVNYKMEFLKQIFSNDITENTNFSIVDVFNKKKFYSDKIRFERFVFETYVDSK